MKILKSIFKGLFKNTNEEELVLRIPKSDFYRTELLCKCVGEDIEDSFFIEHFLMCLYLDFIRDCIKSYNLSKIYNILSRDFKNRDKKIKISNGSSDVIVTLKREVCVDINITMEKESMLKGKLILFEIEEEYGLKITFEELLEKLWLGFIRAYKKNDNKITYDYLIKIIERVI